MRKLVIAALFVLLSLSISMLAWATDENQSAEEKQEEEIRGEIAAGILSAYIWRGQELSRRGVVLQPSIMMSYRDFAASLWGNLDTDPYTVGGQENSSNFTETGRCYFLFPQIWHLAGRNWLYLLRSFRVNRRRCRSA